MNNHSTVTRLARLPRWIPVLFAVVASTVCAQTSLSEALDQYLRIQTQGLPGKVSYSVGQLDQHAQLAPCSAFEPFLPPGDRL